MKSSNPTPVVSMDSTTVKHVSTFAKIAQKQLSVIAMRYLSTTLAKISDELSEGLKTHDIETVHTHIKEALDMISLWESRAQKEAS